MKICLIILSSFLLISMRSGAQTDSARYVLERDDEVAKIQVGPHDGGGSTIGYSFFDKVSDYKTAFRKRVLKQGSSIGYHLQQQDEIYYILSGKGEMKMNGEKFLVKAGDAILTRPGSSHGLTPVGGDLTLIIVYGK